jgi:hypothetical protein
MNERIEWETPKIEAITDTASRADQPDISVQNGGLPVSGAGPTTTLGPRA